MQHGAPETKRPNWHDRPNCLNLHMLQQAAQLEYLGLLARFGGSTNGGSLATQPTGQPGQLLNFASPLLAALKPAALQPKRLPPPGCR